MKMSNLTRPLHRRRWIGGCRVVVLRHCQRSQLHLNKQQEPDESSSPAAHMIPGIHVCVRAPHSWKHKAKKKKKSTYESACIRGNLHPSNGNVFIHRRLCHGNVTDSSTYGSFRYMVRYKTAGSTTSLALQSVVLNHFVRKYRGQDVHPKAQTHSIFSKQSGLEQPVCMYDYGGP